MHDPIAATDLIALFPDGRRKPVRIEIGRPVPDGEDAVCTCVFTEFHDQPLRTYGSDTLQALVLAVRLMRVLLQHEQKRGIRFVFAGLDDDADPLDPCDIVPLYYGTESATDEKAP